METVTEKIREGRSCDPAEILAQIGMGVILATSGGRGAVIRDGEGYAIGVALPCATNRTVEVTLAFSDTYTVRRYRQIVNGANRGSFVVEYHADDIYCEQVSETVYTAGCWQ